MESPIRVKQLTRDEVKAMTPAEIAEAHATGALDALMTGADPVVEAERRRYLDEADAARAELASLPRTPAATPGQGANVDQGRRESVDRGVMAQQQRAALQSMTAAQISAALKAGELDALLGRN